MLSFVTSHVVADASLKLLALEAAATGEQLGVLPSDGTPAQRTPGALRSLGGAARTVSSLARRPPSSATLPPPAIGTRSDDGVLWTPPVVVLDVSLPAWERVATCEGGTSNTLLIALCAELAVQVGRAEPGQTIDVATPVSTRTDGDLRSNASTGLTIPVRLDAKGGVASLAELRVSSRNAYAALARRKERDDPLAAARALLPLLPASPIRRLAPAGPAPLVLAATLGTLRPALAAPTGLSATSVLNRSITPPVTRGAARRTQAGLSAWWGTTGETATLCVAGADPDALPDAATLAGHLTARGLSGTPW